MKKLKLVWNTVARKLGDLVSFDKNPRIASDKFKEMLTRLLKKFNLVELPACDLDGTILAGNQRIAVLLALYGPDYEIEIRVPNRKLTEAERNEYLLASNRAHADWNYDLLAANFDIDTLLTSGFDETDLGFIFDDLAVENDDFNEEAELKKIKKPTVKLGDYYALGEHRLICGSGTDESVVQKLVGKEHIDFVDIDPPFNIKYSYKGTNGKYGGIEKDDRSLDEYRNFLRLLMQNAIKVSKENSHNIFWCDERWVFLLQELYQELGIESKRLCVWVKNNSMPTPAVAFNKATEFACYGTRGAPFVNDKVKNLNTIMNKEVGSGNRAIEDIIDLLSIWLVDRLPTTSYEHPTQKPPELHEKALRRCTRINDTVLDLCAGSGSLMVACEAMKRRAFLCEIDPLFATLILNRYEKLTNKKAVKLN